MSHTIRSIPAHGGTLVDRVLRGSLREAALERAQEMPKVVLSPMGISDLELIGIGAFSPLTGFVSSEAYHTILDDMRLPGGLAWTIPVTLPVSKEQADELG